MDMENIIQMPFLPSTPYPKFCDEIYPFKNVNKTLSSKKKTIYMKKKKVKCNDMIIEVMSLISA